MIKLNQVKKGDYFIASNEGDEKMGEVVAVNVFNKQVCIDNGVQEFWYDINQLNPIPVSESSLGNLKFTKTINENGTVKYSKGAFRVMIPAEGDFSSMIIWYREEKRQIFNHLHVHQLQNHFHEMTKVYLNDEVY